MTPAATRNGVRDLVTTCYDGQPIMTEWSGERFVLWAQIKQAEYHRERVRAYLSVRGLNRLPAPLAVAS